MVYRLFLSHSSPTPESKARLNELAESLRAAASQHEELELLYDQEQIVGGDDWRRRITFMLHVCHGGIVLLDEAALSSKWVLAEATFLAFRQEWDTSFALVPISFLDDVDLERAKMERRKNRGYMDESAWSVVQLPKTQFVRGVHVDDIARNVISALREKGHLQACANPADELASQLEGLLSSASREHLRTLASRVEEERRYLTADPTHLAALAMVREMLTTLRLTDVRSLIDGFGISVTDDDCVRILEGISPLAAHADACAMLRLRRKGVGFVHVSLGCAFPDWTVRLYVKRAYLAHREPAHFAVSNTLGTFEEIRTGLRQGMRGWTGAVPGLEGAQLDAYLDERLRSGRNQVYAWLPGPVDTEVMARLDASYPRVTFIIHHSPDLEPTALPPRVLPVSPPLTREEEYRMLSDFLEATEVQQPEMQQGWSR